FKRVAWLKQQWKERRHAYRERIKKDKVKHEQVTVKARQRNNSILRKLTGKALENFRANTNYRQRKCRLKKRKRLINNKPSSFQNRQSFGKAMKKVTSALPKCDKKKKDVIQHIAQKYNLVPKPVQQRTCANMSDQIKNAVHKFYLRDNVSYQLPGKRDTIVVKNDDNTKITYQKRILLNNLRESFELFRE
ncbi:unnamed protein product, partial [Didymodactylos carnosus]